MYRTVFIPTESDSMIPISIPREWYGRDVEVIVFPLDNQPLLSKTSPNNAHKFQMMPFQYTFSTKNFKFDRDEANHYE